MTLNQQIEAAERVANREPECNCDMRTKLIGDGCSTCNPEFARDHSEDEDECAHQFQRTGRHHDGTQFFKCAQCGKRITT